MGEQIFFSQRNPLFIDINEDGTGKPE